MTARCDWCGKFISKAHDVEKLFPFEEFLCKPCDEKRELQRIREASAKMDNFINRIRRVQQ